MAGIDPAQVFLFLLLFAIIGTIIYSLLQGPRNRVRVRTLQELRALSPSKFEQAVATLLQDLGYQKVNVVGGAGDLARDISAIDKTGTSIVVQCKRYSKSVGSRDIQIFIGMLQTEYRGSRGIYVTTAKFTRPALDLAQRHNVELWAGNYLADLLLKVQDARTRASESGKQVNQDRADSPREKAMQEVVTIGSKIEHTAREMTPPNMKQVTFTIKKRAENEIVIEFVGLDTANLPILKAAIERHSNDMQPKIKQIFEEVIEEGERRTKELKT